MVTSTLHGLHKDYEIFEDHVNRKPAESLAMKDRCGRTLNRCQYISPLVASRYGAVINAVPPPVAAPTLITAGIIL